ncbi:MAG: V-type ATP synthase subunit K [Candidatus Omnitrophica bacterium]|nr:V-type ATP synthase subunit K [Candidatus Omnitrophota bacterium]MCM8823095.1 V-type ATP synthase subunit K [Candidatus Omnitrophota bacterium]MCM8826926.1 V-type ATP synthase subunit K [Candidatus Omnitrophota bacterium]
MNLGDMNFSLTLSAIGSALGTGVAGMSAVGAWKKAFSQNKSAPFILLAFIGAPLTQTIYGMILRNQILKANLGSSGESYIYQMIIGFLGGLAIGTSAFLQGKVAACASDALGETGKGFGQYMLALGIVETVAIFVLVFCMMALPKS